MRTSFFSFTIKQLFVIPVLLVMSLLFNMDLFAGNNPGAMMKINLNAVNGTQYYGPQNGIVIMRNPDGSTLETRADGTKIILNTDGSSIQTNPDGTKIIKNRDGSSIITSPDGTVVVENLDGSSIRTNPDGSKIIINADGSVVGADAVQAD